MAGTGIEALDRRIGALAAGGYYLVRGPRGGGKTTLAIHFAASGLTAGEAVAILSEDEPAELVAHAARCGQDFAAALRSGQLVIVPIGPAPSRAVTSLVADAERAAALSAALRRQNRRLVVDSILPFLRAGSIGAETLAGITERIEGDAATALFTLPRLLDLADEQLTVRRLLRSAADVIDLYRLDEELLRLDTAAHRSPPLYVTLRPGTAPSEAPTAAAARSRPVAMIVNQWWWLPRDLAALLQDSYEVRICGDAARDFLQLVEGGHELIVIGVNPYEPQPATGLVSALFRSGATASIVACSPARGLRACTRTQLLRAGATEVLTDHMPPGELAHRIRVAGEARSGRFPPEPADAEPEASAEARMLDGPQLRGLVRQRLVARDRFFVLVLLRPDGVTPFPAWRVLRPRLRLRDGDAVARMEDGTVAVVLADLAHTHQDALIKRIQEADPQLEHASRLEVLRHPESRAALWEWLEQEPAPLVSTRPEAPL